MSLLELLFTDAPTPARLWAELDPGTRRQAAAALYRGTRGHAAGRREADAAISAVLRFREVAVRRLTIERRVGYLSGAVRPDDGLATSLLLALHLERRTALLRTFLDQLGIPHQDGVIDDEADVDQIDFRRLDEAVDGLYAVHPREQVELYLASLITMEPEMWRGLAEALRRRQTSRSVEG